MQHVEESVKEGERLKRMKHDIIWGLILGAAIALAFMELARS